MMRAYHTHPKFDFEAIDKAAAYIGEGLRKWGRIEVRQYKEKFGEVRIYCSLGLSMWHQIFWPGYCSNQYPWHWLWTLDVYFPRWIFVILNKVIVPYHVWLYRRFYRLAAEQRPDLKAEIYEASDWPELLGAWKAQHPSGYFEMVWPWTNAHPNCRCVNAEEPKPNYNKTRFSQ